MHYSDDGRTQLLNLYEENQTGQGGDIITHPGDESFMCREIKNLFSVSNSKCVCDVSTVHNHLGTIDARVDNILLFCNMFKPLIFLEEKLAKWNIEVLVPTISCQYGCRKKVPL